MGMTLKDGKHRLLSYIPSKNKQDAYVNGKKIEIWFIQQAYFTPGKHTGMRSEDTFRVTYDFESDLGRFSISASTADEGNNS